MRKTLLIILICLISMTLLGSSNASKEGIPLKYFPRTSILKQSLHLQPANALNDIIILPEEAFDQEEAASIIARVSQLPGSLLTKINDQHIRLKLFVGKLTDNPTTDHLRGIIPRGYESSKTWDDVPGIGGGKIVLVKIGHSQKGMGHGSINLELHELAHSVDRFVYSGLRNNQGLLNIWKDEREDLFPEQNYLINYPEEYFAEAFAMFYLSNETRTDLREKAPNTFKFINHLK